jgi:3-hydroxyacyl-CoA dehydrogenase
MKPIEKISVVGLGTLGTQIGIQAAAYGYAVCGFDPEPSAFAKMQTNVRGAMQMTGKGPTFPNGKSTCERCRFMMISLAL